MISQGVSGRNGKNAKVVREFKSSGNKAMQAGSFQRALRLYTKALDLDAGNAILYSNRSAAHFNLRQFAESLEDAESAILCDATWWKAYKRKGLALIHMQRYEEAITALEEGLNIVKKNAEMEKNLEFARACQEQAQNLYILPEPHMMQRLESVPVFIVTDNVGQPFFVTYDDGQQVCTFYFDQKDANATLEWIKTENPDLGDMARVIHITLHQAFNLAQETQKQYYEETTRAAAEEDRVAATADVGEKGIKEKKVVMDVDGDDDDPEDSPNTSADLKVNDDMEEDSAIEDAAIEDAAVEDSEKAINSGKEDANEEGELKAREEEGEQTEKEEEKSGKGEEITKGNEKREEYVEETGRDYGKEGEAIRKKEEGNMNEKVEGNKNEKEAGVGDGNKNEDEDGKKTENVDSEKEGNKPNQPEDEGIIDENAPLSFQFRPELRQVEVAVELLNKHPNPPVKPILRDPPSVRKAKAEAAAAAAVAKTENNAQVKGNGETTEGEGAKDSERDGEGEVEKPKEANDAEGVGEEEVLTVDNFNGIPIFQAKGLTLLQKDKQLIPLFFSKWDLEDAWKQLKESNAIDVPGECEIDVGTLEDVLRKMSESKTDEFQSVFFVPSREAMKAINVKFPLDELAASNPAGKGGRSKPAAKKANFSKAKQIAARGGSKEEIRAAIREDLEKYAERQRMAEIIAQIEHAGRTGNIGGLGRASGGASGATGGSGANGKAGKNGKTAKVGS